jgi:hypothetical protein
MKEIDFLIKTYGKSDFIELSEELKDNAPKTYKAIKFNLQEILDGYAPLHCCLSTLTMGELINTVYGNEGYFYWEQNK